MPRQLANSRSEAALFDFQSPVALRADTAVGVNELKKRTVAADGKRVSPEYLHNSGDAMDGH